MADNPTPPRRKQIGVAIGMGLGLAITAAALAWPYPPAPTADVSARLAQWTAASLVVGLWLFAAVARLARHRFFVAADIDAALGAGSAKARVLQSLLQNTLEQVVLATLTYGAWLLVARPLLPIAPVWAAAGCFCLGRLLFFIGYERGAAARSLGFALTFYPTAGLMAVRAWLLVSHLP